MTMRGMGRVVTLAALSACLGCGATAPTQPTYADTAVPTVSRTWMARDEATG